MRGLLEKGAVRVLAVVAAILVVSVLAVESHVPGELFLLVYGALMVLSWSAVPWLDRRSLAREAPAGQWTDPYLLAYLSGGPNLALRTAAVSLVDRGLLRAEGSTLVAGSAGAAALVQRPIERALLEAAATPVEASSLFTTLEASRACELIRESLEGAGLLQDPAVRRARRIRLAAVSAGALAFLSAGRMALCLARGQSRFGLLVFLTIAAVVVPFIGALENVPKSVGQLRTPAGDALLTDMRTLFGTLPARAATLRPGGATSELAFLVALFGFAFVPPFASSAVAAWGPLPPSSVVATAALDSASSSGGSSVDSSCSSSSCSSCGGGGGCGGCSS